LGVPTGKKHGGFQNKKVKSERAAGSKIPIGQLLRKGLEKKKARVSERGEGDRKKNFVE